MQVAIEIGVEPEAVFATTTAGDQLAIVETGPVDQGETHPVALQALGERRHLIIGHRRQSRGDGRVHLTAPCS